MLERILIIGVLTVIVVAAYYALRAIHLRRIDHQADDCVEQPTLLYFRGDSCAVCPTQGRVVDQLAGIWGENLRIETIDAEREPDKAARYRVLSLPTTILIDADGEVRHINFGLAGSHKLNRQIESICRPAPAMAPASLPGPIESMPSA